MPNKVVAEHISLVAEDIIDVFYFALFCFNVYCLKGLKGLVAENITINDGFL